MGRGARDFKEIPEESEFAWLEELTRLQSGVISALEQRALLDSEQTECLLRLRPQLYQIFSRFSRLMEMADHFRVRTVFSGEDHRMPYSVIQDTAQEVLHAMSYDLGFANTTILKIMPHDLRPLLIPQEHIAMMIALLVERARLSLRGGAGILTLEAKEEAVSSPEDGQARRFILRVSDTGLGFPIGELPHLFDPLHNVSDDPILGLRLFTVQQIAGLHSGTVQVESSARGTSFYVCLPLN
ncbi:MAG: sensor histidine kinase [Candidatus Omnitrophica bacterium]|nr:sensor histidine kinase [Candidatus Omnitrophota bacterium]